MKINLALILSIIVAVGIVSLTFTIIQTTTERQKLNSELELKTIRNAEEFFNNHGQRGEGRKRTRQIGRASCRERV